MNYELLNFVRLFNRTFYKKTWLIVIMTKCVFYHMTERQREKMSLFINTKAAFRPTCICNLAFAHKGFTFNGFSIVFSVMTFQGIIFLESLLKKWFPQFQLWQIKQWKACYLSKSAVIKTETFCRRVRLRQMLQILQRIEKTE